MKILLFSLYYIPSLGGSEVQVHALASQFQKLGHEVLVIASHRNDHMDNSESGTFEEIRFLQFPFLKALTEYNIVQIRKIIAQAKQAIFDFAPDLIHIHALLEPMSFYQTRIFQGKNIPLYLTIHGGLELEDAQKPDCVTLLKMTKAIGTPSQGFLKTVPIQHPNLRVIYNGLPLPIQQLQPIPQNPILGMVGRLSREKGFDLAFRAISKVMPKHPHLKAFLVGDGPEYHSLVRLRKELGLEIVGAKPHSQIVNYLDHASVVLIPSQNESFCLVALEAAQRARPVIASKIPGLDEVIEDKKTGLLISPDKEESWSSAIDFLLTNPKQAILMGQAAYQNTCSRFTIKQTAEHYLNLYLEEAHVS
jgi:glycosyltransferase involved in cell wall biosynthesis